MIKLEIKTTGSRSVKSKEFGYEVFSNVQGHSSLEYANRAIFINDKYSLEERHFPGDFGYKGIKIVSKIESADNILYHKAKQAAKKSLEDLTPELIGSRT